MLSRTFSIAIIEENVCKNIGDELSYRCLYLERSDHPLPPLFVQYWINPRLQSRDSTT